MTDFQRLVDDLEAVGLEPVVVDEETFSPFIPGTRIQYAWDATAIGGVKHCGRFHNFKSQGWQAKEESVNLRFGSEYHRSLRDYEVLKAEGFEHRDCLDDVVRSLLFRIADWNPDHKQKNRETLIRSVIWYLEKFKDDQAKTWIMSDGKPAVEVNFSFELDFGPTPDQPYVLSGKLDKIVVFNGDLFVMDHKTTSALGPTFANRFNPDNQMTLYTHAGKKIFMAPIKGVIINGCQPLVGGTNFERHIVYRTDEQIEEWLVDLEYWLTQANAWAERGEFPHNDASCNKYFGCEFRDLVCSKSPQVRDRFLKANFDQVEPWNPLKPRD
jgi:hypothetical protein